MIRYINRGGGNRGLRIGFNRLGAFVQAARDADENRMIYATLWLQRNGALHYRYPSLTFRRWRIIPGWQ